VPKTIVADRGDCPISLCGQEGFFWETVWNHPENSAVKDLRKQPNILRKGDQVYIPDIDPGQAGRPTYARHTFIKKEYTNFGYIDPIDTVSGIKSRLFNMGFYCGEIDDEESPEYASAIAEFQRPQKTTGEGVLDGQTRDALAKTQGN
jgi:peptidoglycan hydrolase-like protein with peptidoglycan-binding domain